ncbi:bacillithiol system redox-active protein YtxJ [Cohnella rhizosphaerae]|uniref:Bacillithiol system redox-active protein YtxJ n=1 Tax=Cohnella rhizosphaerae TaxID=1457232 RepID=A0A9X4QV75_9BACL|nr:bacillithiol system redox-active protein YtxJ [Cohnella rhizosphaerae]MDG0812294.1 bacillithiol system redox-active protein YtxJ [Cohnella rhizosphaerae]
MSEVKRLKTVEQWEEALKHTSDKPLLVFKHSTSCPISAGAHDELDRFVGGSAALPVDVAIVHVIEERPVSNAIAEALQVQHKSPQAILVRDGRSVWNESHWRITSDFLNERVGAEG